MRRCDMHGIGRPEVWPVILSPRDLLRFGPQPRPSLHRKRSELLNCRVWRKDSDAIVENAVDKIFARNGSAAIKAYNRSVGAFRFPNTAATRGTLRKVDPSSSETSSSMKETRRNSSTVAGASIRSSIVGRSSAASSATAGTTDSTTPACPVPLGSSRFVPSFSLAAVNRNFLLWPIRNFSLWRDTHVCQPSN